jgi:hypothetical protein
LNPLFCVTMKFFTILYLPCFVLWVSVFISAFYITSASTHSFTIKCANLVCKSL